MWSVWRAPHVEPCIIKQPTQCRSTILFDQSNDSKGWNHGSVVPIPASRHHSNQSNRFLGEATQRTVCDATTRTHENRHMNTYVYASAIYSQLGCKSIALRTQLLVAGIQSFVDCKFGMLLCVCPPYAVQWLSGFVISVGYTVYYPCTVGQKSECVCVSVASQASFVYIYSGRRLLFTPD